MSEEAQTVVENNGDFAARITVVEQVYYQHKHQNPYQVSCGFTRHTSLYEQPYLRWCTAESEWKKLDLGWMSDKMGLLVVVNEGKGTLQLAFSGDDRYWEIPTGESFKGSTNSAEDIVIRCPQGNNRFVIHCLPS